MAEICSSTHHSFQLSVQPHYEWFCPILSVCGFMGLLVPKFVWLHGLLYLFPAADSALFGCSWLNLHLLSLVLFFISALPVGLFFFLVNLSHFWHRPSSQFSEAHLSMWSVSFSSCHDFLLCILSALNVLHTSPSVHMDALGFLFDLQTLFIVFVRWWSFAWSL